MGHISHVAPPLGDFTRVQALEQKFVENLTFFIIFERVFCGDHCSVYGECGETTILFFITTSVALSATGNLRTCDICMYN